MNNASLRNLGLLIFRLGIAYIMIAFHGLKKVQLLFSGEEIKFFDPIGIGEVPSLVLAAFAEFICSILIALGLWTRQAAAVLLITMLVAVFQYHADDPWVKKELPSLFLFGYLMLVFVGGGRFSLGALFGKRYR
ncbi:MAG TPA: DoxX family protein [Flavobacteriaceae bacterium]|nr:DoxX family protein [Flavobacteriaceae bacterium]